jgi:aryl-alcohol dehydrogenase-like predicted oxidoreductase
VSTDDFAYVQHADRDGALDVVQVEYNILNRAAERDILPYAAERGIGVVVRGPLQKGLLTGKFGPTTTFPDGDVRAGWSGEEWFQRDVQRVEQLRELEREGQTMGQLALRFVLDRPAVSAAIPGAKTPVQVEANAAASTRPLLSDDARRLIDQVSPPAG